MFKIICGYGLEVTLPEKVLYSSVVTNFFFTD